MSRRKRGLRMGLMAVLLALPIAAGCGSSSATNPAATLTGPIDRAQTAASQVQQQQNSEGQTNVRGPSLP